MFITSMVKTSLSGCSSLPSAVSIEHRPVTDRQTDRQTDIRGHDIHGTMRMRCVVSRGKKTVVSYKSVDISPAAHGCGISVTHSGRPLHSVHNPFSK